MSSLNISVGQKVQLNDGRTALVRFKGTTSFAPGDWIGIELEEPTGKNDGAVQGARYFECEDKYGMFLRGTGIAKILERAPAAPRKSSAPATKPRPSSIGLRSRESLASPTPGRATGNRLSVNRVSVLGGGSIERADIAWSPLPSPSRPTSSINSLTSSRASTPSLPNAPSTIIRPRQSLGPFSKTARKASSTQNITTTASGSRHSVEGIAARSKLAPNGSRPASTLDASGSRLSVASQATESDRASHSEEDVQEEDGTSSPTPSSRASVAGQDASDGAPPSTPSKAPSSADDAQDGGSDVDATPRAEVKIPAKDGAGRSASLHSLARSTPSTTGRSVTTSRPAATSSREIEDLKTKLRMLEKRRLEDREKLKALEKVQQERDRFESIIQRLQTKYQPQQQEISDLKKQLKESETRFAEIEKIQGDHDVDLENATLDREMAEEQYEAAQAELTALREKYEEAELELEVLRDENQELSKEMTPEERTSQGWLQLERSNERYREALIRLRDITQEQEAELKQQIAALEKDLELFSGVNEEADDLKAKLLESEAAINDLKQQLELAQGSEELLEELSDRNMSLQERIDELNMTIDDLENLKEINDELEVNHVEAEKQMQEEIDLKDSLINEQLRRSQEQQKSIEDYEMTVARFREAFRNLQADLEDMRASKEITDTEAEHLNSKSRALIDLNLKLQSSAAKTQIKAMDLELQRLEAEEAAQHLSIVKLFLPKSYQADRDSVLALLRIKRIQFKADLMQTSIKDRISDVPGEEAFAACTVTTRLAWIASMCSRLVNAIENCPIDDFAKFEKALYELDPIERALNGYIDGIKRDSIKWRKVDQDLERSVAVMAHLAATLLSESPSTAADEMIMAASMLQSYLEATASAISQTRVLVESHAQPETNGHTTDGEDSGVPDKTSSFAVLFDSIDSLISQVRGVKVVAGKMHREVSELRARHLCLPSSLMGDFESAQGHAVKLATYSATIGDKLISAIDPSSDAKHFSPHQVTRILVSAASEAFTLSQAENEPFAALQSHTTNLNTLLSSLHNTSLDLSQTTEFPTLSPPWIQRSQLQATQTESTSNNEAEVQRLAALLKDRNLELRTRERELDDQSVRIETLEARAKDAAARTAHIAQLEASLAAAKMAEHDLAAQAKSLHADAARLRRERDELRREADARKEAQVDPAAVGAAGRVEIERARHRVLGLQGAVRALTSRSDEGELDWLSASLGGARDTKAEELRRDTLDCVMEFVRLAAGARMVDFRRQGDRLAWRPVKEQGSWLAHRRREELAAWREGAGRVKARAAQK